MAETATLARPYANALFDVAKGERDLERWSRMLKNLGSAAEHPKVKLLLEAPDVANEQKAFRLIEVCGDELNDRARKFVQVLAINKRLSLLGEIGQQFEVLRALEEQNLDVEVVSAYPLSEAEAEHLAGVLRDKYEKEVTLTSRVDPTLLGGAIIRAGDTVIDGSVRGKLEKLGESLLKN
ncbi:MAG: F0F1 ATP synthase subunit delta [Gammaproteobacteria bacterium]|nr:F0F1 ATP synthase subunit delta [Gammaproteobacteria bacterium]